MKKSFSHNEQHSTDHAKLGKSKLSFFEAILLSLNFSSSPPLNRYSQLIRIAQSPFSIEIKENFICAEKKLELVDEGQNLNEDEAYEIFSHYAYIENRKVSYLLINDKKKIRQRKTKKRPHLHEEIKI